MGHQLLLCSSIPHSKYMQTVSTLQALTGLRNPKTIATYSIITRPHNVFKPKFEPGKVNQIEQYYMKCTTAWSDAALEVLDLAAPITADLNVNVDRLFSGKEVSTWTLHVSDIPNAGKSTVLAHNFYESTVVHHHTLGPLPSETEVKTEAIAEVKTDTQLGEAKTDVTEMGEVKTEVVEVKSEMGENELGENGLGEVEMDVMEVDGTNGSASKGDLDREQKDSFLQFLEDLGYDVVNQYWLKGIRFFYGDIVVEIFKVFVRDDAAEAPDGRIRLKLLDESNTFQIKTYINYPRNANVDLVSKGTKELTNLKATLQNLFDLEVPDRMFMDSRVTRTN